MNEEEKEKISELYMIIISLLIGLTVLFILYNKIFIYHYDILAFLDERHSEIEKPQNSTLSFLLACCIGFSSTAYGLYGLFKIFIKKKKPE